MTTSVGNLNAFSYGNTVQASVSTNKLYVPVKKSELLYSHFDHISGVAAKNGQQGVSISKLSILNSLISSVSAIRNEPQIDVKNIDPSKIDTLIKDFQGQIQQAMKSPYLLSGATPMAGALFSLQV